ncbi:MAG: exopolysaccharide biosynthesis polyprenyl glycosylphosphotransferase [Paludibacteraceae bacterium]|nr:exopolysaccharide biosynthesis polyprenyl glycosylphosphotransferase [Paludibacteraceae bacterium]
MRIYRIKNNNQTNRLINLLVIAVDYIVLCALLFIATSTILVSDSWDEEDVRILWLICTFSFVVAEYFFSSVIHERVVGANDILRQCTALAATQALLSYLLLRAIHFQFRLGWQLLAMGLVLLVFIFLLRFWERWMVKKFRQSGYNTRYVTFIGSDVELQHLYQKLIGNSTFGYAVCSVYGAIEGLDHDGSLTDFKAQLSRPEDLKLGDEVYLCVPRNDRDLIEQTVRLCDHRMVKFYYLPTAEEKLNLQPILIDDIGVMTTYTSPLEEPLNRLLKRLLDIVVSILCLIPTSLLVPFIVLTIKRQSPGPVFFRQRRTGLGGHEFYCYKFRSMHVNSDADRLQATKDDPRKFPFGDFMRRTNLDELPQFWNVLTGNMSIVGPRPHMLAHTEQYDKLIDKYMIRHFVKPGITGWAQVTGFRGETRELWQMEGRVERDIWYIQHWSLWLDLRIIWMTVKTIFKRDEKAY